jgi:hypothetical protein
MFKIIYKNKDGYIALISVLLIGAVATSIAVSLLVWSIIATKTAQTSSYGTLSYSYAEGCVEDALRNINQNVAFTTVSGAITYANGSCSYSVSGTAPNKVIDASGVSGPSTRKIKVLTSQTSPTITVSSWQEVVSF